MNREHRSFDDVHPHEVGTRIGDKVRFGFSVHYENAPAVKASSDLGWMNFLTVCLLLLASKEASCYTYGDSEIWKIGVQ